ncbi:MAG TPA: Arc family DNA-binding protein [Sphingomonadaceae bacterium]|nr:Arc family DNA-binding protein [Sphingomonadaceae bacterium]
MHTHDVQPTSLRLPADLKAQLKDRAMTNRRSLTGEIIAILERVIATEAKEAA